jgi:galactonate dehydratase
MRITAIKTHYRYHGDRSWVITEMQTDEGITGFSEVGKNRERAVAAMIQEFEYFLLGKDPTCIEALWEQIYRQNFWNGTTEMTALSAVEMCMWDILGKSLGAPIYKLLGGPTRERIRLYGHVYPLNGERTPAGFAAGARQRVEQGYTAIKTTVDHLGLARSRGEGEDKRIRHVFREGEAVSNRIIDAAREFLGAIRDEVGPHVDLMVDCHGRFGPADAIRLGSALEDFKLLFFEEPCPPENVEAVAMVSKAIKTPVATGERLLGRHGFWDVLKQNAVAVVQPDVANTGGIMETKKIAAMAEVGYMNVAPHNPNGPLAIIQTAHVAASIPNFLILETLGSPEHIAACQETLKTPMVIRDGYLELPTAPGLGVEPDLEVVARYPWRPPAHF